MNRLFHRALAVMLLSTMLSACSGTTLTGSWKDPEFRGQVHKIYVIGVASQEIVRRIFEDSFERELATLGVTGISSYRDLPPGETENQDVIVASLKKHGADSILMARVTSMRIEQVTSPGYVSGSASNWNSYYTNRYDAIYIPPTTNEFQIATIEANLYESSTGKLIWSAQLETLVENNFEKVFNDFVKTVTKDLKKDGLI